MFNRVKHFKLFINPTILYSHQHLQILHIFIVKAQLQSILNVKVLNLIAINEL